MHSITGFATGKGFTSGEKSGGDPGGIFTRTLVHLFRSAKAGQDVRELLRSAGQLVAQERPSQVPCIEETMPPGCVVLAPQHLGSTKKKAAVKVVAAVVAVAGAGASGVVTHFVDLRTEHSGGGDSCSGPTPTLGAPSGASSIDDACQCPSRSPALHASAAHAVSASPGDAVLTWPHGASHAHVHGLSSVASLAAHGMRGMHHSVGGKSGGDSGCDALGALGADAGSAALGAAAGLVGALLGASRRWSKSDKTGKDLAGILALAVGEAGVGGASGVAKGQLCKHVVR